MALDLGALHRVRGAAKGSLTRLESTVNAEATVFTLEMLTTHENTLNNIIQRFNDVQHNIYTSPGLSDEDFATEQAEESSFEDRVIAIQIKIKQLLRTVPKVQQSPAQQNSEDNLTKILYEQQKINTSIADSINKMVEQSNRGHSNNANSFPKIEVVKFSGNYDDWPSFHDNYTTTIHDCSALSNIQKFQHLRTYLIGDAADVIKHLKTNEENYEIAWELLKQTFEKKQHIVDAHVESLFNLQKITDAITLRRFINLIRSILHALDALSVTERDVWIIRICKPYLDDEIQKLWAREVPSSQIASLEQFVNFLDEHCDSLEKFVGHDDKIGKKSTDKSTGKSTTTVNKPKTSLATTEAKKCAICNESAHKIFECIRFMNAAPSQRLDLLSKANICINCARHQHSVESCTSSNCRKCNMRHNTLLHEAFSPAVPSTVTTQSVDTAAASAPTPSPAVNLMSRQAGQHFAVLPTISLYLIDHDGRRHKVRALLDSCSQPNFITKSLVAKCKIPTYSNHNHTIVGIGSQSTDAATAVKATINSRMHTFVAQCEFSVIDKIVDDQPNSTLTGNWDIPANVTLADPDFYKTGRIDMLLGVEVFVQASRPGKIEGNPILLETAFGYIVAGDVEVPNSIGAISCICTASSESTDTLHKVVEQFRAVEEQGFPKATRSIEEKDSQAHFAQHVTRDESGRYIIKFPTKGNLKLLRESQTGIQEKYTAFLKEYEQFRHNTIENVLLATATYSTASASYLSIRCIDQIAIYEGDSLHLAKQAATEDFYVNDFTSGSSSLAAAHELQCQMIPLMSRGGFRITKWKYNDARALKNIPEVDCKKNTQDDLCAANTTKALGVKWDTVHNTFTFANNIPHWLISHSQKLKTFVGIRVAAILQQMCCQHWHHVAKEHKPVDVASRGTTSKELTDNKFLRHNTILSHTEDKQLKIPQDLNNKILEQLPNCTISFTSNFWNVLELFSHRIICATQQQRFHNDSKSLPITQQVQKDSTVSSLRPFLDKNGIIRIWDKIENPNVPPAQKHTMLLPDKQHYTKCFWKRWSRDFLTNIQQRSTWSQLKPNIQSGSDKAQQSVDIRTAFITSRRGIRTFSPFPKDDDQLIPSEAYPSDPGGMSAHDISYDISVAREERRP